MAISGTGIAGPREFPSTSWSAILKLRDSGSPEYGPSLAKLAELYWRPVFLVIRYGWGQTPDAAKDLTQEFFAQVVLERSLFRRASADAGSFRSLLRAALANFMRNVARDASRQKRGGRAVVVSMDGELPALATPAASRSADEVFDEAWNDVVLSRALEALECQLTEEGRRDWFEAFRRYDLAPADGVSYESLAAELGWTVRKLRRVLTDTRATLRATVSRVVRAYVESPQRRRFRASSDADDRQVDRRDRRLRESSEGGGERERGAA